jgi:hypothetical protein
MPTRGSSSKKKPTKDDAEIFLMLTQTFRGPESDEAMQWFMSEFNVKDYDDYKSKYPGNSAEHRSIGKILGQFEVAGVLVSQGLINEDLYFDTSGIGFAWSKLEKVVQGMQKEMGPALWENAAWLAERQKQWAKDVWKPGLAWKPDRPGATTKPRKGR